MKIVLIIVLLLSVTPVANAFPEGIDLSCRGGKISESCGEKMEGFFGICGWVAVPQIKVVSGGRRALLTPANCTVFGSEDAPKTRPSIAKLGGSRGDVACFTCLVENPAGKIALVSLEADSYKNVSQPNALIRADFDLAIRANLNQIRFCYEKTLQISPKAKGQMAVNVEIGKNGKPVTTSASSIGISPGGAKSQLVECVVARVKAWQFPKLNESNLKIVIPFSFGI